MGIDRLEEFVEFLMGNKDSKGWFDEDRYESEAEVYLSILSPNGILFNAILHQMNNPNLSFYFQWSRLPASVHNHLLEKDGAVLPAIFRQQSVADHLRLNAFDFFMFSFFSYATARNKQRSNESIEESLAIGSRKAVKFYRLLSRQVSNMDINVGRLSNVVSEKKVDIYFELYKRYLNFFLGHPIDSPYSIQGGLSARFMTICTEFWLNQNAYLPSKSYTSYIHPNDLMLTGLQLLTIKALNNYYVPSVLATNTPSLCTEIQILQKPLYQFLRLSFSQWPIHCPVSILGVIELWCYYVSLKRSLVKDQNYLAKQRAFVTCNLYLYTNVLDDFLKHASQFTFDYPEQIQDIVQALTIFDEETISLVIEAENAYRNPSSNYIAQLANTGRSLEDRAFVYRPLFSIPILRQINLIVQRLQKKLEEILETPERFDALKQKLRSFKVISTEKVPDTLARIIHDLNLRFRLHSFQDVLSKESISPTRSLVKSPSALDASWAEQPAIIPRGPKRTSKLGIKSHIPPTLRPITSTENAFLVRVFHKLSLYVENTFGIQGEMNLRFLADYRTHVLFTIGYFLLAFLWRLLSPVEYTH